MSKEIEIKQIRILPMGNEIFPTIDDVKYYFQITLRLKKRDGKYYYKRHSIASEREEQVLVLFQYNAQIIASAVMQGQCKKPLIESDGEYAGYYHFDVDTILYFDSPIGLEEIQKIDNTIKSFNRSAQYIDLNKLQDIYALIYEKKNIQEESVVIKTGKEGKKVEYYTTKYERNERLRTEAIKIHGTRCEICGFSFEEKYGSLGKEYIEVHHIKPLHTLSEEVRVNPKTDMICVCANCHRMLHRQKNKVLSKEQLIAILTENQKPIS